MKFFKRDGADSKTALRAYESAANDRMRVVLSRETPHEDAKVVEDRLRNMVYGTTKRYDPS